MRSPILGDGASGVRLVDVIDAFVAEAVRSMDDGCKIRELSCCQGSSSPATRLRLHLHLCAISAGPLHLIR